MSRAMGAISIKTPSGFPSSAIEEPPLTVHAEDGSIDEEYSAVNMSFGFPPG